MGKSNTFIYPIHLGTITDFESSLATLRRNFGIKREMPCIGWVILGSGKKIIVDTGPSGSDWSLKYHWPLKKEPSQEIEASLQTLGLSPKEIDLVILTHLHWDHCYNLELFSNASFVVQKKELEYAIAPLPADRRVYEVDIPGIQPPWMKVFGRMVPVDKDQQIVAGIRVIFLPGHTPGCQGVIVDTEQGEWVIAGDTVPVYENWRSKDFRTPAPSGLFQNLHNFYHSLKRLEIFGDKVLPSHDGRVLNHSRYPF